MPWSITFPTAIWMPWRCLYNRTPMCSWNNKQTAAENVQIKGRVGLNDFKNVLPGQNLSSDWSFVAEGIYLLLLWCSQQLIIYLPYCWLALQYIEESSSFIDWQFDCLFICLMFKKCLSKCHNQTTLTNNLM
jgi:hypothetical protein